MIQLFNVNNNIIDTSKFSNLLHDEIVDIFNIIGKIIDLYGLENEQANILKSDIFIKLISSYR